MGATRIERSGPRPHGRLLVCLGDSITQGQISSNRVDRLASEHAGGLSVVNAGVNGDLAWNVLQRLDPVIAAQPDSVVLLVGTNDVGFAEGPEQEAMYRRRQRLPVDAVPGVAWYQECLTAILDRLRAETPARLAVLEIPLAARPRRSVRRPV